MKERIAYYLFHPSLGFVLRIVIGAIFIYASADKVVCPRAFIQVVESYEILPHFLAVPFGVVLPYVELVAGIMLVGGFRTREAATIVSALLVIFIIALTINVLRESQISCGCFETYEEPIGWGTVARDVLLLIPSLILTRSRVHRLSLDKWFENRRRSSE